MHVLFINARYHPEGIAGPAFTTQFLAEQLAAEGDQVSVVCRTERPGVHEEHIAGVSVVRIGLASQLLRTTTGKLQRAELARMYPPVKVHSGSR